MIVQLNQDTIQKLKIFIDEGLYLWAKKSKTVPIDHWIVRKSHKAVLIRGYYGSDLDVPNILVECKKAIYLWDKCDYRECEFLRGKFPVITYSEWMLIR